MNSIFFGKNDYRATILPCIEFHIFGMRHVNICAWYVKYALSPRRILLVDSFFRTNYKWCSFRTQFSVWNPIFAGSCIWSYCSWNTELQSFVWPTTIWNMLFSIMDFPRNVMVCSARLILDVSFEIHVCLYLEAHERYEWQFDC